MRPPALQQPSMGRKLLGLQIPASVFDKFCIEPVTRTALLGPPWHDLHAEYKAAFIATTCIVLEMDDTAEVPSLELYIHNRFVTSDASYMFTDAVEDDTDEVKPGPGPGLCAIAERIDIDTLHWQRDNQAHQPGDPPQRAVCARSGMQPALCEHGCQGWCQLHLHLWAVHPGQGWLYPAQGFPVPLHGVHIPSIVYA